MYNSISDSKTDYTVLIQLHFRRLSNEQRTIRSKANTFLGPDTPVIEMNQKIKDDYEDHFLQTHPSTIFPTNIAS